MNKIYYQSGQWMAYPMPEQSFAEYLAIYQDEAQVIWNNDRSKAKAAALPVLNPEIMKDMAFYNQGVRFKNKEMDWPGTMSIPDSQPKSYILSLPSSAPVENEVNKSLDNVILRTEKMIDLIEIHKLQEENARLRSLIEKAFNSAYMTGYFDGSYKSRDTSAAQVEWEQFKKGNNL
jgi:hypothetical protein